jgi:hypothetical protein
MSFIKGISHLALTTLASLLLILLGILYFTVTVFMVHIGAQWAGLGAVDSSTAVLTAGIVTAAAIIGSAIQR